MGWIGATFLFVPFAILWNYLRRRKPPAFSTVTRATPLPVSTGFWGTLKGLVCWILLFTRTFALRPGIYFTGQPADDAPVLVSGNFYLTLLILARALKNRSAKILVVDTGGINIWCSAAKGQFSAREIIAKAKECSLLQAGSELRLILPKFSLAGVQLSELRAAGIRPVIGPLYADELPEYLSGPKPRNYLGGKVRFAFKERFYTALPTAVQFFYIFLGVYVVSLGWLGWSKVVTATVLAFLYPLLFPYLPGKQFAVKGIYLGIGTALLSAAVSAGARETILSLVSPALFATATCIFIGLSYTGNSPVSNYSHVRQEIARFLPVVAVLYIAAVISSIFLGG